MPILEALLVYIRLPSAAWFEVTISQQQKVTSGKGRGQETTVTYAELSFPTPELAKVQHAWVSLRVAMV